MTKGDSDEDPHGYDAFEGHLDDGTPLAKALRARGVTRVVVVRTRHRLLREELGVRCAAGGPRGDRAP